MSCVFPKYFPTLSYEVSTLLLYCQVRLFVHFGGWYLPLRVTGSAFNIVKLYLSLKRHIYYVMGVPLTVTSLIWGLDPMFLLLILLCEYTSLMKMFLLWENVIRVRDISVAYLLCSFSQDRVKMSIYFMIFA